MAVVTAPEQLGGERLHPSVAQALAQAATWLADAGYEIVDDTTPGFTRAAELWYAMQMPEIREFLWPAIAEHGDDGNHSTRTPEYLSPATDWHPIRPIARIRVSWIGTTGKQVNRYYADSTLSLIHI